MKRTSLLNTGPKTFFRSVVFLIPAEYHRKVNNINTRKRCQICSKLNIKPLRSGTSAVNFEHILQIFLLFLLLTLNS